MLESLAITWTVHLEWFGRRCPLTRAGRVDLRWTTVQAGYLGQKNATPAWLYVRRARPTRRQVSCRFSGRRVIVADLRTKRSAQIAAQCLALMAS